MMKILPLFMTVCCLIVSATAQTPHTVVVFGDSITAGSNLPKGTPREALWVRTVEAEARGKWLMVNEGRGGRPTASLGEFETALARNPRCDLLVIALGANDARDVSGSCVPGAVKNLGKIIARAREHYGAELPVLLAGPSNIRQDALGPTRNIAAERDANLRALTVAFEKLAADTGCDFVSLYGVLPPESLAADGVHPDAAGNAAIARVMTPKITAILSAKNGL